MLAGNKSVSLDKYVIFCFACGYDYINHISCFSEGSLAGFLDFYPRGKVPASRMSGDTFCLNYEIDRYQDIIEMLRYEKPIYVSVSWNESNAIVKGHVTTSREPIGEQEGPGVPA
jgi:hypothetical protein